MEPENPAQTQNPYAVHSTTTSGTVAPTRAPFGRLIELLFSFEGRVSRGPYWLVHLGWLGGVIVGLVVFGLLGALIAELLTDNAELGGVGGILVAIFLIPVFIAYIWSTWAITAKRYHDRGKSGWTQLLGLIPYIGGLIVLVECGFLEGNPGPNAYGPGPKAIR